MQPGVQKYTINALVEQHVEERKRMMTRLRLWPKGRVSAVKTPAVRLDFREFSLVTRTSVTFKRAELRNCDT